jgi:two-component system LytT family response regulator
MTARIRCLLVDDEILARLALRQALATHEYIEIVGECGNADEALLAMRSLQPDLIFLDVQMPGMDGFGLLQRLPANALPLVVFATAYDAHALKAFDAGAIDYVLKPIDQDRFDRCMDRVRRQWLALRGDAGQGRHTAFAPPLAFAQRISVRVDEHIRVVRVDEIAWISADGNYVRLHLADANLLHRESLKHLESVLDPARFLRIHRATLVNLEHVREVHPLFHGAAEIVLRDGARLALSRRFRESARHALDLP